MAGGKAVTFARRCWKDGSLAVSFSSDHVNDGTSDPATGVRRRRRDGCPQRGAASCSIRASWPWSIRGTRTARFRGPRRICQQADVERPRGRGLVLPGETDLEMFDRPRNNRHRRTRLKAESSDLLTSVWSKVRDFTDRLLFFRCRGIIFAPTGSVFIAAGVRGPRQHSVWPALRPAPPADSRWSSPVHSGIRVCPPAGRGCRAPGAGRVR